MLNPNKCQDFYSVFCIFNSDLIRRFKCFFPIGKLYYIIIFVLIRGTEIPPGVGYCYTISKKKIYYLVQYYFFKSIYLSNLKLFCRFVSFQFIFYQNVCVDAQINAMPVHKKIYQQMLVNISPASDIQDPSPRGWTPYPNKSNLNLIVWISLKFIEFD